MTRHQLQCFFLERLGRLVELRADADASWTVGEHLLIAHALYATYQDCERVGLRRVARAVVELRRPQGRSLAR
jgi:hypothetical protein